MGKKKIENKISRFFDRLSGSRKELSVRTGISTASLGKWVLRGSIPAEYSLVFMVECMEKGVAFPPGCFKMYKPKDERIVKAAKGKFQEAAVPAFSAMGVAVPREVYQ